MLWKYSLWARKTNGTKAKNVLTTASDLTANETRSYVNLSLLAKRKTLTSKPTNHIESTALPRPASPQNSGLARYAIAYAQPPAALPADYYRLGMGVCSPYKKNQVPLFSTLREFVLDVEALLMELLRGGEDPFADLRGRQPIVIHVEDNITITPVIQN